MRLGHLIAAALILLLGPLTADADVRSKERSHVRFEGALGRMLGLFGGKAMKEGIVSSVAVKGDRKVTMNDTTGQIIDLNEEKVYDLNLRDRTFTVTTFAEMRRRIEEAQKKAAEQVPKSEPPPTQKRDAPEVEIDFDLKESGQKRSINGFDAREVIMTVTAREKGKTVEQTGGLVLVTNSWLTPKIAGLSEVADFDRRYAEKLHGPMMLDAQQMAMIAAMYPMLKDAMARMQKENVNLDGTPVMTTMRVEAAQSAEQAAQAGEAEKEAEPKPTSVGGLGGMLGRRIMRRGDDKDKAAATTPGRTTIMTFQHEVLQVAPAVSDADVAIPAGFKQKP